ncbi:MAG: Clp protease ClpP [Chromatiales bacterium]|nr:Clp protease ClpP [Gammaproteobacteria bacterium]
MNPLHRLLSDNRQRGFVKSEAGEGEATVYLYDVITGSDADAEWLGGVGPESFTRLLRSLDAPVIHLRINSPGGDVFGGRAIEQAVREHRSKIIAHVDGYAASAASYIAIAADEVEINPGGFFMIHKAWTVAFGNADDIRDTAQLLEKIDNTLVDTYAAHTGAKKDQIESWMKDETWFSGEEAVALGFADRLAEPKPKTETPAKWNMAAYAKAPPEPEQKQAPETTAANYDTEAIRRCLEVTVGKAT